MTQQIARLQNAFDRFFPISRSRFEPKPTLEISLSGAEKWEAFQTDWPHLASFLGGYFPAHELDYASDRQMLDAEIEGEMGFEEVVEEARRMLSKPQIPWRELTRASGYAFRNDKEARRWLSQILDAMESQLKIV